MRTIYADNAATTRMSQTAIRAMLPYMDTVEYASVYHLFAAKAAELVDRPEDADLIVSDEPFEGLREGQEQVRSCDTEKLLRYLNE